jgi:cation diffusion facilitator CzcD-associated flavoprotein CzcO
MAYRSCPFPDSAPLFPRAHHVEDYLRSYASSNDLKPYIRFETTVTRVYKHSEGSRWVVESLKSGDQVTEGFDFVSVTNGHYEKASIPEIPGLEYALPLSCS